MRARVLSTLKRARRRLRLRQRFADEIQWLRTSLSLRGRPMHVVPGHYYSPIPSIDEIRRDDAQIFGAIPRTLSGVDLREPQQLELLEALAAYYPEIPFGPQPVPGLRFYYENSFYSYSDAIFLHSMIRHFRPRRIIEIGSGFSSCVTLDTNDRFFAGAIETTFIEPYPASLLSLLTDAERATVRLIPSRLQDVELERFDALEANDILFVDSTHVTRINSDVNRLFFDILPRLASGVLVHFHDIFYPFEYPRSWALSGLAWNEAYLAHAFLQYNSAFRILLMNTFLERYHEAFFRERMPDCLKNPGGSLWLQKV